MKKTRNIIGSIFLYLLAGTVLVGIALTLRTRTAPSTPLPESSSLPSSSAAQSVPAKPVQTKKLIGVWVPYFSLQTPENTEEAFLQQYAAIVEDCRTLGANALFVHVCAFADALYPSEYYPVSHIVTGEQGTALQNDILAEMIACTHAAGLEFHAWVNPLRVKTAATPASLSAKSPYRSEKQTESGENKFLERDGAVWFNPACAQVRETIIGAVRELVRRYPVDGVHIDDYFYPEDSLALDSDDYAAFVRQSAQPVLTQMQWRMSHIDRLVSGLYAAVKAERPQAVFGISPRGVVESNEKIGADVKSWCAVNGYADYICPQLYYSLQGDAIGFSQALKQWKALPFAENVKLYIGLAGYKCGTEADNGTWLTEPDILQREADLATQAGCDGFCLYGYDSLHTACSQQQAQGVLYYLQKGERKNDLSAGRNSQ